MKNLLLFGTLKLSGKAQFLAFFFMLVPGLISLNAQVHFTQTLNADFNKGVLNNTVVSNDNVFLQYAASNVGTWLTTTVLPQTLTGHKTVTWNDKYVFLVGGYNNLNYSNAVYKAAIQAGGITNWTALNPLPVAIKDPAVVVGTNTIYVIGGRDDTQIYNTIYYAAINTDGTIGSWQESAVTLPVALWGHTATYLNGYIYVVGGSEFMAENTARVNIYYAQVKADNTLSGFANCSSLTLPRNKHTVVTYKGKLFLMGGYDNSGTKSNIVYSVTPQLNGHSGGWLNETSLPVAISNHATVVTNGLFIVMAGAVGATLSNTVYYANADGSPLVWQTSPNVMYDYTKDGAAFQGNGLVYYSGGTNLSGTPIINTRYANLNMTTDYVNHGMFLSNPFYELGAERIIDSLTFTATYSAGNANCQVSYRTAGSNKIWGSWTTLTANSPIIIGLTKQYLQYYVVLTGQTVYNSTFHQMRLSTPGTQLAGNLNGIATFTQALSPYWVTSDISFTGGTHTFEAGATILFLPQTGMTVSQANIICNGTAVDSVKFLYFTSGIGEWDGIYFDPSSDDGVSSQFYYTVIGCAGYGTNNANLYCYQSNEPLLVNCCIRDADGNGIRLNTAHINIQNSIIKVNTENGMYLESSNPTLVNSSVSYNGGAGVYHTSTSSVPNFSSAGTTIDHNLYALRYPSPNFTFYQPNGTPTLTANTYNGVCIDGGDVNGANSWWNTITYDYILLGTVRIVQYASYVRLTIEPGNTIKALPGVQIQIGTGSNGGELYALGTVDSVITFTAHNGLAGGWDGIYFHDNSDNYGGQSQMDYCVIEKGNDYNYYSVNTTQPNVINHTKIQNALLDGARYSNASGTITNCQFLNNGRYPLYYLNPQANPVHTGNSYSGNVINRIALSGGNYEGINRTLNNDGVPYYVLDDILMMNYSAYVTLTVDPGVTVEFASGKKLQLGTGSNGGCLNAIGTSISPIIFKAYNNTPGGWAGIYFHDNSDSYGATSSLAYCTITQGATYNVYCEHTSQPSFDHCTISNSASHGLVEYDSSPQIHYSQFLNNNGYPVKYNNWSCNSHLLGNTYSGNTINYIGFSGGDYDANRIFYNDGIPYHVFGNIRILLYSNHPRITIEPGVTLAFDPGIYIQVGGSGSNGGDLYAVGNADSIITFKPYNDAVGGWGGISFPDQSDAYGSTSTLKYCNIDKGATYNIYCVSTTQPTIDNCLISNSASHGIREIASSPSITNCEFLNNAGYPLKYDDWSCNSFLSGNTYTGNNPNYIALSGGDYEASRTFYNDGIAYHISGNIRILQYVSHPRITIKPGVTLAFEPGIIIQVGGSGSNGGDLYAEGSADSVIIFKPYNNAVGGWGGIYFSDQSDSYGSNSSLKYCSIEKGANYNVYCENTTQPAIDHCILTRSTADGLSVYNSPLSIKNSSFIYNTTNGIYINGTSTPTIGNTTALTCNFYENGGYNVYNNSVTNVNAKYNYWGTADSTMIALKIFDRNDNTSKGYVIFGDFAQIPAIAETTMVMSGTVKYANASSVPMQNAAMTIKDFGGTTIATTTTNTSGVYTFSSIPSGNYKLTIVPSNSWGGGNATDGLLILQHFVQSSPLTGMNLAAADVNYSHSVNATDAFFVMMRDAELMSSFPAGDYLYHTDTMYVNDNLVTNNFEMRCFGDVNGSYLEPTKAGSKVSLIHNNYLFVNSFTEFKLPMTIKNEAEIGALSLGIPYPEEYLEIIGVEASHLNSHVYFSAREGLARMDWADLIPMVKREGEIILTLTLRSKDLSGLPGGIKLGLDSYSEMADGQARIIGDAILEMPEIQSVFQGMDDMNGVFGFSICPNPIKDQSIIAFSLVRSGRVKLSVYDMMGNQLNTLIESSYPSGNHQLNLDGKLFPRGMYLLRLSVSATGQSYSKTIKFVVSK